MNLLTLFQQKLQGNLAPVDELERFWDEKAENFYKNQIHGSTYYNDAVTLLLEEKGIITPSASVLVIGSGAGRFTISLARKCKAVHALDVSKEMLQFLQNEKEKHQLQNITTIKSAWPTKEYIGEFDVAFAAMCPATRSLEGIEVMTKVAKKYAVICQYTQSTDNVIEQLQMRKLITENKNDPHNNRELLQAYFNILWELGFNPEISYLYDTFEIERPLNEAIQAYQQRFPDLDEKQLLEVLTTIPKRNEKINIVKKTALAVLSWNTMKEM